MWMRRLALSVATVAVAGSGPAAAHARVSPGETCIDSGTYSQCKSNEIRMAGGSWSDIDLNCPDSRPRVTGLKAVDIDSAGRIWLHGPYDPAGADGGHFWVRANAANPFWFVDSTFKIEFECSPE